MELIVVCHCQSGDEDGDEAEEEGDEQITPYKMGTSCLDALAMQLPSRQIMPNVMHHVSGAMTHPDKLFRCFLMST